MSPPHLRFTDLRPVAADFHREVLAGLTAAPKRLSPKFFYDTRGSRLFDAICETPEYYPTRTEFGILRKHAGDLAAAIGPGCILIEPGAGSMSKVRLLLDHLHPAAYLPQDIARDHLLAAARKLAMEHPRLHIHAVCMDYSRGLDGVDLSDLPMEARKVVFFPGSTIGNFEPAEATGFLRAVAEWVGPDGGLLIGVDLKKEPERLHRAYNDAAGLTREFNRNLLHRINADLSADFDPERFHHYAFYEPRAGRIEMHLISQGAQQVRLNGTRLDFADGESIHTENSYKYTVEEFETLAVRAGFRAAGGWCDDQQLFSVRYFERA